MERANGDGTGEKFLVGTLGSLGAGLMVWWIQSRFSDVREFPYSTFIDPEGVSSVAADLPPDEDSFILSAWELVGGGIPYERRGSDVTFVDGRVQCQACVLPLEVLKRGRANCLGKSALLVSILRNRLPASRVYMVIGTVATDGIGGHAWAVVQRPGGWYVLEATRPPKGWVKASDTDIYAPSTILNDQHFSAVDSKLYHKISRADCASACACLTPTYPLF